MNKIDKTAEYFCYDCHSTSGRPKMEEALYDYARKKILYRLIAGVDFDALLRELKLREDVLQEQHRNWRRTTYQFSGGMDGHVWLVIGEAHLSLRKVEGNF